LTDFSETWYEQHATEFHMPLLYEYFQFLILASATCNAENYESIIELMRSDREKTHRSKKTQEHPLSEKRNVV